MKTSPSLYRLSPPNDLPRSIEIKTKLMIGKYALEVYDSPFSSVFTRLEEIIVSKNGT